MSTIRTSERIVIGTASFRNWAFHTLHSAPWCQEHSGSLFVIRGKQEQVKVATILGYDPELWQLLLVRVDCACHGISFIQNLNRLSAMAHRLSLNPDVCLKNTALQQQIASRQGNARTTMAYLRTFPWQSESVLSSLSLENSISGPSTAISREDVRPPEEFSNVVLVCICVDFTVILHLTDMQRIHSRVLRNH
jgi:hypothetical protein